MNRQFLSLLFFSLVGTVIFERTECKCGENSASGDSINGTCSIEGNSPMLIASGREKALIEYPNERTVVIIKPDGVVRGLIGECIKKFENRGYKLVAMKFTKPSIYTLQKHYYEHLEAPYMKQLTAHMQSAPIVVMVWEGRDVVAQGRKIVGTTNPNDATPGTIRGDYGMDVTKNVIHASSSVDSGIYELKLWFTGEDIVNWNDFQKHNSNSVVHEIPQTQ